MESNPLDVAKHFQQLAYVMIQTTKTLQSFANELLALSDKDLEAKLKVLGDILEFKFQIPSNIYVSILAMTT